jgi:hypothetical protein
MTHLERYQAAKSWQEKSQVMEIYHLSMGLVHKDWTIAKTANYFCCSIGLTSENLRIAEMSHKEPSILLCNTRQEAVGRLEYLYD